jgi:Spy/CpxP family protein refolding chaperone
VNRFACLVLIAVIAIPRAFAEDDKEDDWMQGRLFAPEVVLANRAQLKLTDTQRDLLRKELIGMQAKASEIDFEMLDSALELQALIERHPVDVQAALAVVDTLFAAENRKKRLYLEMLINIKNSLTPAQVQTVRELTAVAP